MVWGLKGAWVELKVIGKKERRHFFGPVVVSVLSAREVGGMRGVAVKCVDITQNSNGEGGIPAPD